MTRQHVFIWTGGMLVVGGLAVAAPVMMGVAAAAAAAGLLLYWFGRCRHGGRLGLLPPTTNADGSRTPARWYCDQCGRSWPAGLDEHDSAPVVRFSGYDPSKLPAAARRAAMLEKQRQALAVKRAGLGAARAEAPAAASATVTSITRRRVAG